MARTRDMTQGSPIRNIILYAVPILLGALFQQFYSMTDTVIVGRILGQDALAAVGATGSTTYLILGFTMGMTQGATVLIAQAYGAHDVRAVKERVAAAMVVIFLTAALSTVLTLCLTDTILRGIHMPENAFDYASAYLRTTFAGILLCMAYNLAASILRAMGDSQTPLYFLIGSSFLNIFLDWFFMAVLQMGTAGAAFATVLSQGLAAIACFIYMFRNYEILRLTREELRPRRANMVRVVAIGVPMALNNSITALGIMSLQSGINQFGTAAMAAYTAASKLESLVSQWMIALGNSVSTYCGQNNGARQLDRISRGVRISILLSFSAALLGWLIYYVAGNFAVQLFIENPSQEVMGYFSQYLNTSVWFLPFLAWIYLFRGAVIGLGHGMITMFGGTVELICRAVCVPLLLPLGFAGICFTNPIDWTLTSIFFAACYHVVTRTKKRRRALLRT